MSYSIYQAIFFSDASLRSQDDDPAICLVCGRLFNAGEVYNNFYTDEIQYDYIADYNDYVRSYL